ncbi:unnamed protein product [Rotaria magnacalcarata]|uniref:Transposase n=1 Tax=Rotaria magnacalcarata TaxID=392030 RepID=A0A820MV35_9BILA|nr:unnamed protein product [Rotaria magnacalcarata]
MFDIDRIYNSQNDRIWAVNRLAADISGGIRQKRKFPQKVMVWLAVCSKGVSPVVIFENGTVDHDRYIKEVLPAALKFGNDTFGAAWTFQQDDARSHIHAKSQECPDLNPLDYCIWDEPAHQVNWETVKSKKTLINEVKRAVRKVSVDVVFESCSSWINRLSQVKGNYLR